MVNQVKMDLEETVAVHMQVMAISNTVVVMVVKDVYGLVVVVDLLLVMQLMAMKDQVITMDGLVAQMTFLHLQDWHQQVVVMVDKDPIQNKIKEYQS
jgi:hypothetical protein